MERLAQIPLEQNAARIVHIASVKTSPGGVEARRSSETCVAPFRQARLSERIHEKVSAACQTKSAGPKPAKASIGLGFARDAAMVCTGHPRRGEFHGHAGPGNDHGW